MNKQELIDAVSEVSGLTKKDAKTAISAVFSQIADAVASGDRVTLVGFGAFETRRTAARTARNPQTGAIVQIPASVRPVFSAGKEFKQRVLSQQPLQTVA